MIDPLFQPVTIGTQGSKKVVLLEMAEKIGSNFGRSTKWSMLQDVNRYGIETRTQVRVLRIEEHAVVVEENGQEQWIPADGVVLAVGTLPYNPLEKIAAELNILCKTIGDARKPATVLDATHQGFRAGLNIP